jgi:hypothetical protein
MLIYLHMPSADMFHLPEKERLENQWDWDSSFRRGALRGFEP